MVFKNGISYNIEKTWVSGRSEDGDAGGEGHTHSVLTEGTCGVTKRAQVFDVRKTKVPGSDLLPSLPLILGKIFKPS